MLIASMSSTTVQFTDVDFTRLDIDAEQLVASLFGDDDSFSTLSSHQQTEDLLRQPV